jgi:hypothetical protein
MVFKSLYTHRRSYTRRRSYRRSRRRQYYMVFKSLYTHRRSYRRSRRRQYYMVFKSLCTCIHTHRGSYRRSRRRQYYMVFFKSYTPHPVNPHAHPFKAAQGLSQLIVQIYQFPIPSLMDFLVAVAANTK